MFVSIWKYHLALHRKFDRIKKQIPADNSFFNIIVDLNDCGCADGAVLTVQCSR